MDRDKQPASVWAWIAGIGVLALIAVSLVVVLQGSEERASRPPPAGQPPVGDAPAHAPAAPTAAGPVSAFRTATAALTADDAADGARLQPLLVQLAAAVGTIAEAAPERAARLRARVDSTGHGDWRVPRQALLVRDAFDDASAVIAAAAERGMAGVDAGRVHHLVAAAGAVTIDRPLAAQGAEIAGFLRAAAQALPGATGEAGEAAAAPAGR